MVSARQRERLKRRRARDNKPRAAPAEDDTHNDEEEDDRGDRFQAYADYYKRQKLFPRSGDGWMVQVAPFNTWYTALKQLIELSVTGATADIDLDSQWLIWTELSYSQTFALGLFFVGYTFFTVLTAVLLLNLLVAMLSATYENVQEESTLKSRTAFAQLMMRHELLANPLGVSANVGTYLRPPLR